MQWRWALFRRTRRVLALTEDPGGLLVRRGRVEIRFSLVDARAYRARRRNLSLLEGEAAIAYEALPPAVSPGPLRRERRHAARAKTEAPPPKKTRSPPSRRVAAARAPTLPSPGAWLVHADGSYRRGRGGAGVIAVTPTGEILERAIDLGPTRSSYVAEAAALHEAVAIVPRGAKVTFFTDCLSLVDALGRRPRRSDLPLLGDLRVALAGFRGARVEHVHGHAGHPLNERADELAGQARLGTASEVARPRSSAPASPTDLSSLSALGERAWRPRRVARVGSAVIDVVWMAGSRRAKKVSLRDETLIVLEGTARLVLDGARVDLHQGELLAVPRGVRQAFAAGSHGVLLVLKASS